jgi:Domain of unknown function (DUF3601)
VESEAESPAAFQQRDNFMPSKLPKQTFTASELAPGRTYRLTAPFVDFDGVTHPVGESWRFLGKDFLPYEDGLTLFVERDGKQVWLRLQWRRETQGDVIDHFSDYVEEI